MRYTIERSLDTTIAFYASILAGFITVFELIPFFPLMDQGLSEVVGSCVILVIAGSGVGVLAGILVGYVFMPELSLEIPRKP